MNVPRVVRRDLAGEESAQEVQVVMFHRGAGGRTVDAWLLRWFGSLALNVAATLPL